MATTYTDEFLALYEYYSRYTLKRQVNDMVKIYNILSQKNQTIPDIIVETLLIDMKQSIMNFVVHKLAMHETTEELCTEVKTVNGAYFLSIITTAETEDDKASASIMLDINKCKSLSYPKRTDEILTLCKIVDKFCS